MSADPEELLKNDNDANQEYTQWVTFLIANELYGIDVTTVKEVLHEIDLTPVPGAPRIVLGIINLRGNVVAVIDPRKKFNLPKSEITTDSRIVVTELNNQVIGILVDSIQEVIYLETKHIESTPKSSFNTNKYIQGVCKHNNNLLLLIDLHKLFAKND